MTNDFIDITPLISLTSMPYATAWSVISKYSIEAYNYTIAKHIYLISHLLFISKQKLILCKTRFDLNAAQKCRNITA